MEKEKSIKVNMMMNVILTTSNFIFPLITYAYVARVLLPAGMGKVAFVQSVLSYFSYIASLGISGYGIRECAKVRDDRDKLSLLVQEILRINFISTIVAYIALLISLILVPKFHEYAMLFVIMSSNILLQTLGMEWLYTSLEKYTYITVRSIVFKMISVALTFILINGPEDYLLYGFITIFATSASNILNFINSRKYVSYKKFPEYKLKKHIRPIMYFFCSSLILSIYGNFDSVMLGFMKGDGEVGIYNAAVKMKGIILAISTSLSSVLIPRMSVYFGKGERKKFNELILKSLRVILLVLIPLCIFVFLNSKNIIEFVCGKEYLSAEPTLKVLVICVVIVSFTSLFGNQILIPKGNEKRYSTSVFIGMFINLSLNLLFIPKYASVGAAVATLVTELFNVIYMGIACKEEINYMIKNIEKKIYILPTFVALIAEIVTISLTNSLPLFVKLVINTIVMFGIYYLILMLKKEPILHSLLMTILEKIGKIKTK